MKTSAIRITAVCVLLLSGILTACSPGAPQDTETLPAVTVPKQLFTVGTLTDTPSPEMTVQVSEKSPPQAEDGMLLLTEPPLEGPAVADLQSMLLGLGYHAINNVSGVFDEHTDAAVRYFQWYNRLPVNGIVNQQVLALLNSPDVRPITAVPPYPGSHIKQRPTPLVCEEPLMQGRLVELGYLSPASEDLSTRMFGQDTENAVGNFQQTNGLPYNGQVDLLTWSTLFSPLALPHGSPKASFPELNNPPFKATIYPVLDDPFSVVMVGKVAVIAGGFSQIQLVDTASGYISAPVRMGVCEEVAESYNEISEGIANVVSADSIAWVNFVNNGSRLQGIDPVTGETTPFYDYSSPEAYFTGSALGFDGNNLWISGANDQVLAVNPPDSQPHMQRTVGYLTRGVMVYDGACMWVAKDDGSLVAAFDTGTAECRNEGDASMLPVGTLAFDDAHVWSAVDGMLFSVDLFSGEQRQPLSAVPDPSAMYYANGVLWVADRYSGSVAAVDPANGEVLNTLSAGLEPAGLAGNGQYLWVLNRASRTFVQLLELNDSLSTIVPPLETALPKPAPVVIPEQLRSLTLQSPRLNGPDVLDVQNCLIKLGFDPGLTDGWYGPMSAAAVEAYQLSRGLQSDGVVGTDTWQAIFSECAEN